MLLLLHRYLLNFGDVSDYLGYSALQDFFPRQTLRPNPDCDEFHCRDKQKIFQKSEAERKKREALEQVRKQAKQEKPIKHDITHLFP